LGTIGAPTKAPTNKLGVATNVPSDSKATKAPKDSKATKDAKAAKANAAKEKNIANVYVTDPQFTL
jgi:hypothetical protein